MIIIHNQLETITILRNCRSQRETSGGPFVQIEKTNAIIITVMCDYTCTNENAICFKRVIAPETLTFVRR